VKAMMGINVLVVDDSAIMRTMVQKILVMTGVPLGQVHEAGNGEAALAKLQTESIDLMMLDISMPVMRGDHMLELMRRDTRLAELPVIVASSERSGERIEQVQRLGAHYIPKPFAPEQLREVILKATGVS
jgi:two-component system, chemotaxis family, chemotaxis protein CheY